MILCVQNMQRERTGDNGKGNSFLLLIFPLQKIELEELSSQRCVLNIRLIGNICRYET